MAIPRLRSFTGPALLSYGFRPFFLFGAAYAGLALLIWLPLYEGHFALATGFAATDWHAHEMLYGYAAAIVAGFLLTAIPNWTGRLPLNGWPLLVLVGTWAAGRLAVAFSALTGWWPAALVDVAFLLLVIAAAAREIVAGKNWRNLRVLVVVAVLALANIAFHVEARLTGTPEYARRLGLAALVLLVVVIGGRIIPSFTRNWLARENPGRLPAPFDRFDAVATAVSAAALLAWVVVPESLAGGLILVAAGLLQAARLARWAGDRTLGDPLVLILHVGYAFIPAGFLLLGLAALGARTPQSAGVHAWSVGAIGVMTLAVMTRATRGHTGRALAAPPSTQFLYAAVIASAALRVGAALLPGSSQPLLWASAIAWIAAFWGFCAIYGPMLLRPRLRGG